MNLAETLFKCVFQDSATAVVIFGRSFSSWEGAYANASFEELTGFSAEEIFAAGLEALHGEETDPSSVARLRNAMRGDQELRVVLRSYRKDGCWFWNLLQLIPLRDERGRLTHYLAMLRDVTTERSYAERLEYRAHHDPLTGLPNRHLLDDRLGQAILQARRAGRSFALIFADVNYFKLINDTFGHDTGDRVLRSLAERLTNCARADDTVCRYGGDEFVIIFHEGPAPLDVAAVRERISRALTRPILVDGRQIRVSCSVGISVYPTDGCDRASLFRRADSDMYSNKPRYSGVGRAIP